MPAALPDVSSPPADPSSSPLRTVGLLVTGSATVLTPLVYWTSNNLLDAAVAAVVAVLGALFLFMLRRGCTRYAVHFLVYGVMTASSMELLAFGSVRAAGGFMMVAAVAGAGIFLGRKPLIGVVIYGVVSLGVLTAAEQRGWLIEPNHEVGLKVWLTHSAVLVVVAIMVFYSRTKTQVALELQQAELERRIRSEQERDQSLERFTRIFRNSPSPMIAQSARNGLILDVNPAFERCYGRTREDVLGCTDEMLWAEPEQRTGYLEQLFAHRRADRTQVKGVRADGSRFDALISSEMGDDPQDRLVITIVTDISEQNATIERLRRSEERFAKAFNFSPLKMTITRLSDGTFVEVNQARDPVQGLGRSELLGKTTLETGGWLSQEEREAFIERIRRDGHVSGYETRMRHTDGRIVDTRMWAELIELDGEDCILSCFVNTTDQKRREAQLLALTRGMAGLSGDALFQALTMHMAQALGADMVTVGELRSDRRVRTLAVWKDGGSGRNFTFGLDGAPCGEALNQTALCVYEQELAQRFPQDVPLATEGLQAYVGQSLRDDDGTPIGVLNAFWRHPIHLADDLQALIAIFASRATAELMRLRREREIRQLNATLEQRVQSRTAELQKLNAELDSFAYSVSHDLKSPLRAIDGFTSLLSEQLQGRLSSEEQELLDRVLASTHRMSTLIADLLALARVSQGEMALGMANLSEIAEQVMQAEQAKHPDRPLAWRIEPGLVSVCDARLARIALENLLGNAVKYTRNQPQPLIEMGRYRDGDPARTTFFVRDNGVGFNMAYAEKLFKPFQRLHGPSEFEGTGIGLATVRRIVDRHGGHIEGFARPGEGAEFRFSLTPATAAR